MPKPIGSKPVLDRLASAGIGIRDQVGLLDFLSALEGHRFLIRGAISLSSRPVARVFVLDQLPAHTLIGRRVSRYDRVAFIEARISGHLLAQWCRAGSGQIGGIKFEMPKLQDWATWDRQPSRWTYSSGSIRWPVLRGEVNLEQPAVPQNDNNFLIGDRLPTFPALGDAMSYYLYPGEQVPSQGLPTAFITTRIADTRCWIDQMNFAPAHIAIKLRGRYVAGARVELVGPQIRREAKAGVSGRLKIAIPGGVDPQQILVVSRGRAWLDYRYLGRSVQQGQPGVTFEPPDRCTQIAILATQGEQQTVEYKRQLPATDGERAKLARTVVAFANTQGGYLIYGIESDGATGTQVVGVQYSPQVADTLIRIVRDRVIPDPRAEVVNCEVGGKHLVAVIVDARPNRFFAVNTVPPAFYIRRQANTFPATLAEIRELGATLVENPPVPPWGRR
jgi:hypothetical protein